MNARLPEIQNAARGLENVYTTSQVSAVQEETAKNVDKTVPQAYDKESSNNSTEANPNNMSANPEANPEAQAGLDRETQLKAIFAQLEEAMKSSDTARIAALRQDLVSLGIPESELPSAEDGQEAIETGLKIINLVRKLLNLNPENLEDWDKALAMVKEENVIIKKAFKLQAIIVQTIAEKTLGLEAIKAEWASKSEAEQISYLSGQTEGLLNRINEVAANMPFNKLPYLALRGMKRGLGAAQALVSDRSLATIPTVDLVDMIFTGVLPTDEDTIEKLEKMLNPVDLNSVANLAEKAAPVVGTVWGPEASAGVKVGAKLLNLKDFTNRGYFEACRELRAERRDIASVREKEEAAAMNVVKAANNNKHFRQTA